MLSILPVVFATIFIAEMGDKTQLLLVAMAGKYRLRDILIGTWAATAVLNLIAVAAGAALANYLDMRIIKSIAALAFFRFSMSILKGESEEEEEDIKGIGKSALIAIFTTFFIGELGDKTQLSGIALAASYTDHSLINAVYVFLGCTIGLIAADFIGLMVGLVFKSKLPEAILNKLSAGIFAVFGVINTYEAGKYIFGEESKSALILTVAAAIVFVCLCSVFMLRNIKEQRSVCDKGSM